MLASPAVRTSTTQATYFLPSQLIHLDNHFLNFSIHQKRNVLLIMNQTFFVVLMNVYNNINNDNNKINNNNNKAISKTMFTEPTHNQHNKVPNKHNHPDICPSRFLLGIRLTKCET